jgi:hypothetical protein
VIEKERKEMEKKNERKETYIFCCEVMPQKRLIIRYYLTVYFFIYFSPNEMCVFFSSKIYRALITIDTCVYACTKHHVPIARREGIKRCCPPYLCARLLLSNDYDFLLMLLHFFNNSMLLTLK